MLTADAFAAEDQGGCYRARAAAVVVMLRDGMRMEYLNTVKLLEKKPAVPRGGHSRLTSVSKGGGPEPMLDEEHVTSALACRPD